MNDRIGIKIGIATAVIAITLLASVPGASAGEPFTWGGNVTYSTNGSFVPDGWPIKMMNLDHPEFVGQSWGDDTHPYGPWNGHCVGEMATEDDRIYVNVTSPDGSWYGEFEDQLKNLYERYPSCYERHLTVYSTVPTYTISGYTTPAADTVNITNTNNSKEWPADVNATGFYNLTLNVGEDVNATEILQIVAC